MFEQITLIDLAVPNGTVDGPFGSNLPASAYTNEGVPVIRGVNLSLGKERFKDHDYVFVSKATADKLHRCECGPEDLIFTKKGTLGQTGIVPANSEYKRFLLSSNQMRVRIDKEKAEPKYVYYFVSSSYGMARIIADAMTAGVPKINLTYLRKFQVLLPDLQSQRKIAAILTAYDDLVETNNRRIALLENMAEELYREWFVRMRFPGHQDTKFVKGVPDGWEQKRFGEFCMLKRGYDLPNALVEEGPYPVVASTSVKTFHKHYKAEPPVITTGRSGSLGDVLMTQSRAWPLNTALYVRKFFGNSPYLVFYILKNMGLEKFNSGAGVPTLNRNHVNGIPMAIPDKNLQQRFEEIVEPLHKQAEGFRLANLTLTQIRDLLLPRLISGKLSVEHLNIQFPPSMQEEATEPEPAHA